ncbi:hypothetical protein SFRURICE_006189, partial [Spodoptera frugiperda]
AATGTAPNNNTAALYIVAGDAPPPPLFMEDEDPEMSLMFEDSYRRLSQTENTGPDLAGIRQMLDLVRNLDRDDDDDSGCIGDQSNYKITISKVKTDRSLNSNVELKRNLVLMSTVVTDDTKKDTAAQYIAVGDAPPPSLLMDDDDPEMSLMFGDSYRRQTENTGSDLTGIRQVLDLVRNLDRDDDDDDSGDIAEATGTVPKKDTAAQYMVMRDAPPPPLLMEEEDSEMSLMFGDSY